MELKKITNAVPQLHFKGSMSTSDQWLSISSPEPSSKVLQGGWSFYLYNSVATLLCILSWTGTALGHKQCLSFISGLPETRMAYSRCSLYVWMRNYLELRVSGEGKRNHFNPDPSSISSENVSMKKFTDPPSEWQVSSHSEIKKNKNGLVNFIPRKFAPFLSASGFWILSRPWSGTVKLFKKMRFQEQAGPDGKGVSVMWRGFHSFFGKM